MRKITLLKLLEDQDNGRSIIIKDILDRFFSNMPDEHHITFSEVLTYLNKEEFLLNFDVNNLKIKRDTELFYLYLTGAFEKNNIKKTAMFDSKLTSDDKKNEISSIKSNFFKPPRRIGIWQTRFMRYDGEIYENVNSFIINEKVADPEKLYRTLCRISSLANLPFSELENKTDLYGLSGEIRIIKKALDKNGGRDNIGWELFIATALSGSINALKFVAKTCFINIKKVFDGFTAMHYGAMSGSVDIIKFMVEEMKAPIDIHTFQWAAWGGSAEGLAYLFKVAPQVTADKVKLLYFAAMGGSVATLQYLSETLKVKPALRYIYGDHRINLLHFAAWSGSEAAIKYVLEKLHIDPRRVDCEGRNLLYYAAISCSAEVVRYVLKINNKYKLNLYIDAEDRCYSYDDGENLNFFIPEEIKKMFSRIKPEDKLNSACRNL